MKAKKLAAMLGVAWIGLGSYVAIGACQSAAASTQTDTRKNTAANLIPAKRGVKWFDRISATEQAKLK